LKKFDPKRGDDLPAALSAGTKLNRRRIRAENYEPGAAVSEHVLQCAVARYLDAIIDPLGDCLWWAVPNGGVRPGVVIGTNAKGEERRVSKEGQKLRAEGQKPGVADIHILFRSRLICIEMKKRKPKTYQSQDQKDWELDATAAGALYIVCRSVQEVEDLLDTVGIIDKC
jgi:hypothetical protein